MVSSGSLPLACSWSLPDSDYFKNRRKMKMTNKIPQGVESWCTSLTLNPAELNAKLAVRQCVDLLAGVCVQHHAALTALQLHFKFQYLVGSHLADGVTGFQRLQLLQTPVQFIQSLNGELLVRLLCSRRTQEGRQDRLKPVELQTGYKPHFYVV